MSVFLRENCKKSLAAAPNYVPPPCQILGAPLVSGATTINFSHTITLSTCQIYVGFRPTVLGSSFCITIKFLMIVMQKLGAKTVGLKHT